MEKCEICGKPLSSYNHTGICFCHQTKTSEVLPKVQEFCYEQEQVKIPRGRHFDSFRLDSGTMDAVTRSVIKEYLDIGELMLFLKRVPMRKQHANNHLRSS